LRRHPGLWRPGPGAAGGGRVQPLEVEDDDPIALEPDQAIVGEEAEQLVHALAGASDHRRQVALGQRTGQPDRAVGQAARPGFCGEPGQARRKSAGDVEEMQLLDMVSKPADLGCERGKEGFAHDRLGRDQLAEPIAGEDVGLGRLDRDRRCRTRRTVEQGKLTEEVTRPKGREDRLVAGIGG